MSKLKNEYDTAEAWLRAAFDALRPDFEAIGKTLPAAIHRNFGFTSHGSKKTGITGQYYDGGASTDKIPKLIIRCNTDDPAAILEAVVHQCVHAVVGVKEGHGKAFREVALRIGLEPPMRTSKAGKRLRSVYTPCRPNWPVPKCPTEFRDDRRRRQGKARRGSAEEAGKPAAESGMPCKVRILHPRDGQVAAHRPAALPCASSPWIRKSLFLTTMATIRKRARLKKRPSLNCRRSRDHGARGLAWRRCWLVSAPLRSGRRTLSSFSAPDDAQTADIVTAIVVVVGAYGGFQGLRRCFRGAGSAFWTSTLGRWLIGRIAGTLVFGGLSGTGFLLAQRALESAAGCAVPAGHAVIERAAVRRRAVGVGRPDLAAWHLRTIAKVCIGKGSRPLRRLVRSLGMGGGGSSAFAGICEEWSCRWKPGMILLGASMFDRKWLVGIPDDRGIGGRRRQRRGKGRSSIIPNLLTYPGSVYCQDFKGQNAAVTAQRRRDMGQAVHILEPMGEGGARFNPLQRS